MLSFVFGGNQSPLITPPAVLQRLMRVEGKLEDGGILNENLLRKEESPKDNSVNVLDWFSMNTALNLPNISGETRKWPSTDGFIRTGMKELEMICRKEWQNVPNSGVAQRNGG